MAVGLWYVAMPFVEEPWMAEQFGAEYAAYQETVPRFFSLRALRRAIGRGGEGGAP